MTDTKQTQFRVEGQPAFQTENTETDNSTSSSEVDTKETTTNQTGELDQNKNQAEDGKTGGDDKGFADHPAWKSRESDWKSRFNDQERRHSTEVQQLREGMESAIASAVTQALKQAGVSGNKTTVEDVPEWFGGDEKMWGAYQSHTQQLVSTAVEQALKQFSSKSAEEQKAIDDATKFFQDEVATIESDKTLNSEGRKIDRNKLLKTAIDNDLIDSKGRWNYRAAFKMMKPEEVFQAKQALKDRKQIAGATTESNRADQKQSNVVTSEDFANPANRPW